MATPHRIAVVAGLVALALAIMVAMPTVVYARGIIPGRLRQFPASTPAGWTHSRRSLRADFEQEYPDSDDDEYDEYEYEYPSWPGESSSPSPPPPPPPPPPSPPPPPPRPSSGRPLSSTCKQYSYTRYISVRTVLELQAALRVVRAGDMVEIMPGTYRIGVPGRNPEKDPAKGWGLSGVKKTSVQTRSLRSLKGNRLLQLVNKRGTPKRWITVCGSRTAVLDGADQNKWKAATLRIKDCAYVRIAGFTMQRALKAIDIQNTSHSEFVSLRTLKTLQEGVRLRFDSKYNLVKGCHISDTGLMWAGVGEGIYIGTGVGQSVARGLKSDRSDFNVLDGNRFGPKVLAEGIDVKEYTTGGVVTNNIFDGASIKGINGATSWVVIKGNRWIVRNNTGSEILRGGTGYRVSVRVNGWGHQTTLSGNLCTKFDKGSYCIYLHSASRHNVISCTNTPQTGKPMCNCQLNGRCGFVESPSPAGGTNRTGGGRGSTLSASTMEFPAAGYDVEGIDPASWIDDEDERYRWD